MAKEEKNEKKAQHEQGAKNPLERIPDDALEKLTGIHNRFVKAAQQIVAQAGPQLVQRIGASDDKARGVAEAAKLVIDVLAEKAQNIPPRFAILAAGFVILLLIVEAERAKAIPPDSVHPGQAMQAFLALVQQQGSAQPGPNGIIAGAQAGAPAAAPAGAPAEQMAGQPA